ncbi:MAG: response regulator [Candidatus Aminicenantales bacterium]|jgi:DNA-binding NarL/FixJ family response regulator
MKIFIVEDSKLVIERLTRMFSERPGQEVVGTSGGAQKALKGIDAARPDVVILDLRLQGGTGWDVLRTLKSRPISPVVIMLTNFPSPLHRVKARQYGADYFLDKAEEFDKLGEILDSLFPSSPPLPDLPNSSVMV